MRDIFGSVHLGYVVVQTTSSPTGNASGLDAVGLHVDELTRDVTRFRLDDRECRFLLQRGPKEDVTAFGWHVDDHETFDIILGRVAQSGLPVVEGTPTNAPCAAWSGCGGSRGRREWPRRSSPGRSSRPRPCT